jgi:hypothetical protein
MSPQVGFGGNIEKTVRCANSIPKNEIRVKNGARYF